MHAVAEILLEKRRRILFIWSIATQSRIQRLPAIQVSSR